MSGESGQRRNKKRFGDRLIVLITVTASLATIIYYITSPTFHQNVLEYAVNCRNFLSGFDHNASRTAYTGTNPNSQQRSTATEVIQNGVTPVKSANVLSVPAVRIYNEIHEGTVFPTNYIFTIENDTESDLIEYFIDRDGKSGPRHILPPHRVEYNALHTAKIQICYNASPRNDEDQYYTIQPLAVAGRPLTEDDWENAPFYSFEPGDGDRIILTNYDN